MYKCSTVAYVWYRAGSGYAWNENFDRFIFSLFMNEGTTTVIRVGKNRRPAFVLVSAWPVSIALRVKDKGIMVTKPSFENVPPLQVQRIKYIRREYSHTRWLVTKVTRIHLLEKAEGEKKSSVQGIPHKTTKDNDSKRSEVERSERIWYKSIFSVEKRRRM